MTRTQMAQIIVDYEARRDSNGKLRVYKLPSNDGGGTYEVAGINDRYHPEAAARLKKLIEAGLQADAEKFAVEYIAGYTDAVRQWSSLPAVEFFLRDSCFNRGPGGAAKILQLAVRVKVDGNVGPVTKAAAAEFDRQPIVFIGRLRVAREAYENIVAPGRPNLRLGLENRWDKVFAASIRDCFA